MATIPNSPITRPLVGVTFEEFDTTAATAGFVGAQVMPVFNATESGATFSKLDRESYLIPPPSLKRAEFSGYNRSEGRYTEDTWQTEEYGDEELIDDRKATREADRFNAEQIARERITYRIAAAYEQRVADACQASGVATVAATAQFDNASADPIKDIITALRAIRQQTGFTGAQSVVVIPITAYEALVETQPTALFGLLQAHERPTPESIGQIIQSNTKVGTLLIAEGQTATTAEGQSIAAGEVQDIWNKNEIWVGAVSRGADLAAPGFGRTISWAEDGSGAAITLEQYRDESVRGDVVRGRQDTDEKTIYIEAARRVTGVLS